MRNTNIWRKEQTGKTTLIERSVIAAAYPNAPLYLVAVHADQQPQALKGGIRS